MVSNQALSREGIESATSPPLPQLRPGDIILIDLGCYVCRAISITTGSPYNHVGLVIEVSSSSRARVAQALGRTDALDLESFLRQAKDGSAIEIRRSVELDGLYHTNNNMFVNASMSLKSYFESAMAGRPYDRDFLWDNMDADGNELLYCSEMVQKTLNHVLNDKIPTTPMDFSDQMEFWDGYFNGHTPQGAPGNSPATLAASRFFRTIWRQPAP
jgi:Permuted papain-like amidase enzyme, YaeF/YiiX, C92 family